MPTGIEPSFCPNCGGELAEVKDMATIPKDDEYGFYEEGEAD
jgi:hypothetical protein